MSSRLEEFRFARWANSLNRTAQIVLSLVLVAGLNYLAARHYARWDLTTNHRFSVSAETRSYINKIDPKGPPVRIILNLVQLLPQPTDNAQTQANKKVNLQDLRTLLREYEFAARDAPGGPAPLKIEEVDIFRDSAKAAELKDDGMADDTYVMVVHQEPGTEGTGKKPRVHLLALDDLYDLQTQDFKGENALTSAILDVTESKAETVYFTEGHGEMTPRDNKSSGLSSLALFLRNRNFTPSPLVLVGNVGADIPPDAKLVIIAAPQIAFQPYEVAKLRKYLDVDNGRVMVFLKPPAARGQHTGFEDLFSEWGILADEMQVVERDPSYQDPGGDIIIKLFGKHDITSFLAKYMPAVDLSPLTRPVRPDQGAPPNSDRVVTPLLGTSEKSVAFRDFFNGIPAKPGEFDLTGQEIPVAMLAELHPHDALGLPGGRLLVFGNADFIANQRFNNMANAFLIRNTVDYLLNRQNLLNIPPKPPLNFKINLTKALIEGLSWRLALLPLGLLVLGIFVYVMRRRA